jgi:hypothetical protein
MELVRESRLVFRFFGMLILFTAAGCTGGSQTQFDIEHTDITLSANDLKAGGIGFLTPAAATKLEADKQALAQSFSKTLQKMRPDVEVVSLPAILGAVNTADLDQQYKEMYRDYLETSILEGSVLKQVGDVGDVRYLAQLSLSGFDQTGFKRLGFLGLRLVETKQANIRVFIQIWDSHTASVAWEGGTEMNYAYETSREMPVTFNHVARLAAERLFSQLPGDMPLQEVAELGTEPVARESGTGSLRAER